MGGGSRNAHLRGPVPCRQGQQWISGSICPGERRNVSPIRTSYRRSPYSLRGMVAATDRAGEIRILVVETVEIECICMIGCDAATSGASMEGHEPVGRGARVTSEVAYRERCVASDDLGMGGRCGRGPATGCYRRRRPGDDWW